MNFNFIIHLFKFYFLSKELIVSKPMKIFLGNFDWSEACRGLYQQTICFLRGISTQRPLKEERYGSDTFCGGDGVNFNWFCNAIILGRFIYFGKLPRAGEGLTLLGTFSILGFIRHLWLWRDSPGMVRW